MGSASSTPEEAIRIANESGDCYPPTKCEGVSKIRIPENATSLPKKELINRIKGLIYGSCIGDAIGLATEFMTKEEASFEYGNGLDISYRTFKRDFHRGRWAIGDWTDDSDQMILLMDTIFRTGGELNHCDFAARLKYWTSHGWPELGDLTGLGIGQTVTSVVRCRDFCEDPHQCAKDVWEQSQKFLAANGAVMRTSILGIPSFHNMDKVIENTRNVCLTTHADPRCIASCVAVTAAIALILQKGIPDGDVMNIINPALDLARRELDPNDTELHGFAEFDKHLLATSLSDLKLDDKETIGYTYKCVGSAFYCLRTATDYKKSIVELIMEAGDADSNAAVAGALIGCKLGFDALPKDWLHGLKEKQWLDKKVDRLLGMLGLN